MGCCLSSDYKPPPSCDYCKIYNDIFIAKYIIVENIMEFIYAKHASTRK